MLRGLQHVAVVRVDLLEAMLLGTCQVERVTRSDENSARKIEDGRARLFQQLRSHAKLRFLTVCVSLPRGWAEAGRYRRVNALPAPSFRQTRAGFLALPEPGDVFRHACSEQRATHQAEDPEHGFSGARL